MQYFTIFRDKLQSVSIQEVMGFQRKRSKNVQNDLYGQPVLTFDERQICSQH